MLCDLMSRPCIRIWADIDTCTESSNLPNLYPEARGCHCYKSSFDGAYVEAEGTAVINDKAFGWYMRSRILDIQRKSLVFQVSVSEDSWKLTHRMQPMHAGEMFIVARQQLGTLSGAVIVCSSIRSDLRLLVEAAMRAQMHEALSCLQLDHATQ